MDGDDQKIRSPRDHFETAALESGTPDQISKHSDPASFTLRLLKWGELWSIESDHSGLKKNYLALGDQWFLAINDEAVGPLTFREVMKALVDGHSPLSVLHASEAEMEEPNWVTLAYKPLWQAPWIARGWTASFWFVGVALGYCVMLGFVPADWRLVGQVAFLLGVGGMAARSLGWWPKKKIAADKEAVAKDLDEADEPSPSRRTPVGIFAFCLIALVLGFAYIRLNEKPLSVTESAGVAASTEAAPSSAPVIEAKSPVFIPPVAEMRTTLEASTAADSAEPISAVPVAEPSPELVFSVAQIGATPDPSAQVSTTEPVAAVPEEPQPAAAVQLAPLDQKPVTELEAALRRSGLNRPALEKAATMTGDAAVLRAMATIIARSRTIDLVNYSTEHLLATATTAVRTRSETPWGRSIPDELWTEYVLPPRIADEEMDDWRLEFYETLKPVMKESRDTKAAVQAIHKWLWTSKKVRFQVDESRDRSPRQTMKIGIGRCFEINILFTALLRSAGIPARHAGSSWWYTQDFYHYWVEYYDSEKKTWDYIEGASENPNWFMARDSKIDISTAYALPGWAKERDPIGREAWSELTDVTERYVPVSDVRVITKPGADVTAYTWNMSAWRSVAQKKADERGECVFRLGASVRQLPYLISATEGEQLAYEAVRVEKNQKHEVRLQPADRMSDKLIPIAAK